eukprot:119052-Ditylum_brightwellii.AAC.1
MGKTLLSTVHNNKIKRCLRHILRFNKSGRPVTTPGRDAMKCTSKCRKMSRALHPVLLLLFQKPDEEVVELGMSATG